MRCSQSFKSLDVKALQDVPLFYPCLGMLDSIRCFSDFRWTDFSLLEGTSGCFLDLCKLEKPNQPHSCCIRADHRGVPGKVVDLLYRNDHRRIGFLGVGFEIPDKQSPWEERMAFFLRWSRKICSQMLFWNIRTIRNRTYQALTRLLRKSITILICPSITEGAKIAWILQVLRWRIPKDISIVVGDSVFSNQVNPIQLTAMRMPYEKIAESCSSIV